MDDGLSIQDAARTLGVSEKTVRRRIKAGTLSASRLEAAHGFEWRVHPDVLSPPLDAQSPQTGVLSPHMDVQTPQSDVQPTHEAPQAITDVNSPPQSSELLKALELIEEASHENKDLQHENKELFGQVAFYQARIFELETRLKLLEAPKEPELVEAAPSDEPRVSWWRRLFRGG